MSSDDEVDVEGLRANVRHNTQDAACHLRLIDALRNEGDLGEVRIARECFASLGAMPATSWIEWLGDESRLIGVVGNGTLFEN